MIDICAVISVADVLSALPVIAEGSTVGVYAVLAMFGAIGLLLMYGGYSELRKKRQVENVPTSKAAGVTIGLNELTGSAVTDAPLVAPVSNRECIFYTYQVLEHRKKENSKKNSSLDMGRMHNHASVQSEANNSQNWHVIDKGIEHCDFQLRDETGSIQVRPTSKELMGRDINLVQYFPDLSVDEKCAPGDPMYDAVNSSGSKGRKRHLQEWIIPHGAETYVMGPVQLRDDILELEVAADPDLVGIDHHFVIAPGDEQSISSTYFWKSVGNYFGGLLLGAIAVGGAVVHAGQDDLAAAFTEHLPIALGVVAALWLASIVALYFKTVYDGLVEVKNREQRAWSMLDVEFKRRHELIPKLAEICKSIAGHEQQLQEATARARSAPSAVDGAAPDQAAQAIDRQTEALSGIFALAEDYPEITTDQHFQTLMEELSTCEQKIALARQFYNSSVERLNTRVRSIPDIVVAPLAGANKEDFLQFSAFESKPQSGEGRSKPS